MPHRRQKRQRGDYGPHINAHAYKVAMNLDKKPSDNMVQLDKLVADNMSDIDTPIADNSTPVVDNDVTNDKTLENNADISNNSVGDNIEILGKSLNSDEMTLENCLVDDSDVCDEGDFEKELTVDDNIVQSALVDDSLGDLEESNSVVSEKLSLLPFMLVKPMSRDRALLILSDGANVFIKGKLELKVLRGSVEVLGHTMAPSDCFYAIYSPRGFSLLDIKARSSRESLAELKKRLRAEGVENVNNVRGDCVVLVRKLSEGWTKYLHKNLNLRTKMNLLDMDKNLPAELMNEPEVTAVEKLLNVNLVHPHSTHLRLFKEAEDWGLVLSSVTICQNNGLSPRVLVAGGKGVGKSTLMRWLTNKLLVKGPVVFVDLDPGQAELTLQGYLSISVITEPLLGPNFSHTNRSQEIAFFLGDINVSNCPARYLQCARKLSDFLESDARLKTLPVVVNTMGWCQGVGLMLLIDIIRLLRPSTVVQLHSRFHMKNFPHSLTPEAVSLSRDSWAQQVPSPPLSYNLLEFAAVPESLEARDMRSKDNWGIPDARLIRQMVTLSCLGRSGGLLQMPVYRVPFSQVALHVAHTHVEPGALLAAFNLAMVDLCAVEQRFVRRPRQEGLYCTLRSTPLVPSLGFGVVRNIDTVSRVLYIATSTPPETLQLVTCLVAGSSRLPDSVLLTQKTAAAPYLATTAENPLDLPWQRNFKPRGHSMR